MPKLGSIWVDDHILDAIREDGLVVFAGAGVSMGPPADLPDFLKLANDVAAGTGLAPAKNEPIDRFLGRLAHGGADVHRRAAERLSSSSSKPTGLHADLLRLFLDPDRVRLVTTNFDLHFEAAAQTVFGRCPETFRAPALPLGRDFRGLVHVHGALTHPAGMVLTDADFGRGYLTEGWARRFLLEVFRTYSVLFVGYSHNDVVMNYLARALPAVGVAGRYALTEEEEDEDSNWKLLGITPIPFCKSKDAGPFQELYEGVRYLAERVTRGALDWQSKLAEIGNRVPPADDETAGEIEQALRELHTTRFLLNVARRPEWPGWLHARGQLDTMFGSAPLNDRDRLLAWWLADHYAIEYADEVIGLVAAHNMQLNPALWWAIGCRIGRDTEKSLRNSTLFRWVTILLASTPTHADLDVLEWLAERCVKHGNIRLALEVFLFMGNHELDIKPDSGWPSGEDGPQASRFEVRTPLRTNRYTLNEVWEKHLKPNLATIAQPLLSGIVRRLENIHHALLAWDRAGHDCDEPTWARSAIEPHRQDQNPEPIDVLIDAGRDALEWLALHQPEPVPF